MIHFSTPNGQRFTSYNCRNFVGLMNRKFWTNQTFHHGTVSWQNFTMTTLKTPNTELVANYLIFLLVTHMVSSDARFDSYEFSKTGHGAERFWTDWTWNWNLWFKDQRWVKLGDVWLRILQLTCSPFQCLLIHTISVTTSMVMTV
jgi:hypothetical protein